MSEIQESIASVKPYADSVVETATALNAAIRAAAEQGLTVKVEVMEERNPADDDGIPIVRTRISKRIA